MSEKTPLRNLPRLLTRSTPVAALLAIAALLWAPRPTVRAAQPPVHSDKPNEITFPEQDAKFVRMVIRATNNGTQPGVDELEVYGPGGKRNLALARDGAKPSASSCLPGYAQHAVEHLNDGEYGNARSWIAATSGEEWAQIELPEAAKVSKVVFSRDRNRQYGDRVPIEFDIRLSLDGKEWKTVREVATTAVSGALPGGGAAPALPPAPPPPGAADTPVRDPADLKAPEKDGLGFANLALSAQAKPAASSVFTDGGMPIHQIAHLNDGLSGNSHSWISKAEPSWAEVDLGGVYWVYKAAFGSDTSGRYPDRAATSFSILAGEQHDPDSKAATWTRVYRQTDGPPIHVRTEFKFKPVQARWIRIAIDAGVAGPVRIDEIEVFGRKEPIPLDKIGPLPPPEREASRPDEEEQLRYAFLGEEHAWVKTYGRADLDPTLVPYNGRVKEYPRHVGDDRLPLPPLTTTPELDGSLHDPCWAEASRGVVRVAHPYDFERGPLVEHVVRAGWRGDSLYLAVRAERPLSSHLAVVSSADWQGCGVVAFAKDGLVFNTYTRQGRNQAKLDESTPLDGALDPSLTSCEVRLPLDRFPDCRERGLRVGLGMGGRHTGPEGRPVHFVFSSLSVAEVHPCLEQTFRVRLTASAHGEVTVSGNASGLEEGLTLPAGQSRTISIPADRGAIGPECSLQIAESGGESYALHLFRYDPLQRTLTLAEDLADRLAAKGLDVAAEQRELAQLRERQEALLAAAPDLPAERHTFFEARLAKRRLFFREPDLAPIESLLFVKRHAFHPSHIYTDYTDAPFRPGGGVCLLDVPRRNGRFEPGKARLTQLFDSGGGIARNPVATPDLGRIYFGHRPAADGFYHLMAMNADGSGLTQLTDGPFHDFYPCPLPDGGVAFISTRCTARVFCFRGGSSVLFRMDPDGGNIRPLSHASLSEWAPSVMTDGRIIWTRWEYVDKGADFGQTLWAIRPDGTHPELVFGNTIIQPNGYACGREVPGTQEISCTLVSHFGDINGPLALLDLSKGRFSPAAITSLTPEVPWPGNWPRSECFRDPVPLARDYFLCAHAPRDRFGLYVIDRFGSRELVYMDPRICSMAPTLFRPTASPPSLPDITTPQAEQGRFVLMDVYQGIEPTVARGSVKYIRVVEEVRHNIAVHPNRDHTDFMKWYATPVDVVSGPYGWPAYVAKAALGLVPVEEDGSANFRAPAGKTLYFQALDEDFNELQRMRSVVQLQPGETRTCVGCHERRHTAPPIARPLALLRPADELQPPSWGADPFSYERVVQPVLDARCVSCHDGRGESKLLLTGALDANKVPASYRALISGGWVHYVDCGWNSAGCEKNEPLTFGTVKSKLWPLLDAGHYDVALTIDEMRALKTWTDLNCPLWPDYIERSQRPAPDAPAGNEARSRAGIRGAESSMEGQDRRVGSTVRPSRPSGS